MVIYELHVRDFTANSDIQTVIDSFSYLKKLGINVLELMPVSEFEGNDSWGYNPAFYFAPDKAYGTRNKLKELIDSCHTNGIAVLLDMVLNHSYGLSPLVQLYFDGTKPTTQNPWYNVTSPNTAYSWGYDFNHQSADTKIFVDRVNKYWLTEYKFDGFRFDFTKGFTNTPGDGGAFDQQRIDILKRMNAEIKKVNPNAIVILEHFADNAEEKILAADGMFVWGNITYSFGEAAMGWHENNKSDFTWLSYKARQYTTPNVVGYMESHDEERIMFKALTYGNTMNNVYPIKNNVENALDRSQLNALFLMCTPGPKMIWQFGELGYDISIDFNGRVGRKPVKWEYFQEPSRKKLYDVYCAVNKLKTKQAAMSSSDFTTSYTGTTKSLTIKHADFDLILVGNYGVFPEEATVTFTKTGWWYNYLTGDSVQVTDLTTKFVINPSGFRLLTSKKIANSSTITALPGNGISSKMAMQSFPNPFVNEVVFSIDSETSEQATMSIYSIGGKLVHNQQINLNAGNNQISWNTDHQDLENGLYVCVVHSKSASYICKIVKN